MAALIIGGMTAWYLGLRAGGIAAVATAVALLVAAFVPGITVAVYSLAIAWVAALYFLGPKLSVGSARQTGVAGLAAGLDQVRRWAKAGKGRAPRRPE